MHALVESLMHSPQNVKPCDIRAVSHQPECQLHEDLAWMCQYMDTVTVGLCTNILCWTHNADA